MGYWWTSAYLTVVFIKVQWPQDVFRATQTFDVLIFSKKVLSDVQSEIHLFWRNIAFARQFVRALDIYLGLQRVLIISGYGSVCLSNTWICFNVFYYARTWLNIAEFPWICLSKLFWIYLIILDIWQCFEYAWGIQYVRVLNMPQYSYNNIKILLL